MDLKGIMLNEMSDREKQIHMISLIYGIYKIRQTSKYNKNRNRLTDTEIKLVVTMGKRERGEDNKSR